MLYTASFYQPDNWHGDVFRVSRYHPRGRRVQWESLRDFYPTVGLLRSYRDGQIDFSGLTASYTQRLNEAYLADADLSAWIDSSANRGDFTLLCYEREGHPCHRLVLARWLKEKQPALELASPLR